MTRSERDARARPAARDMLLAGAAALLAGGLVGWLTGDPRGAAAAAALAALAFVAGAAGTRRRASPAQTTALEQARADAARARDERDALQRSLAHDLRSPLGAIVNFVSVLEEDCRDVFDADARGIVARIRRAAESGLRLADGLSRLSRVSQEAMNPEPLDVEELVGEAARALGTDRRVEVSVGALPRVHADRALLREAFTELLTNAVKFSSHREKVQIVVGGQCGSDGDLLYWVADDGAGFDAAAAVRLFRPFERLHSRDDFPGAGVGLAVVRRIAERHGGRVWAVGDPERGARFFLSLPAGVPA